MGKAGRPALITEQHLDALHAIVQQRHGATMAELCGDLERQTGVKVCTVTLRKALLRAGLQRVAARPAPEPVVAPPRRYGYTAAHRRTGAGDTYASSLTDAEWALAADLFETPAGRRGRPPKYDRRTMLDACCYVLRSGGAWHLLPTSFPPWLAVHKTFSRWAEQGKFEQLQQRLREQWRQRLERTAQPSAAVIDSQSTRISPQGGTQGYDAGKKVKGRKRHLVVDTLGLLLAVSVTAASVQDRDAAPSTVAYACERNQTIVKLYADAAYAGHCAATIEHASGIAVEVVRRPRKVGDWSAAQMPLWPATPGFVVLPMRWVVERTHAWIERCRRLVMHHDRSPQLAEAWVWLAQAGIFLRRLVA
ncbi:MAG: IS5 family transposase [Chloroflexi bacterium]|nr:IS5 family transposase [Chloroflexota bacterium]